MDYNKFVESNEITSPVGMTGCRALKKNFDSCDHDITVFDGSNQTEIMEYSGEIISLHHGSLDETRSDVLVNYDGMEIIQDESWDLRMFVSKIKEKREKIFLDYAKNRLVETLFCCQKTKDGIKNSDEFAPCWQKSASLLLADGICGLNMMTPSSHLLDSLRQFEKNQINEKISAINETIGMERATPILLERMVKSTIGFSDFVEKNSNSKIIQKKFDYFLKDSKITDCYFYLCHENKDKFLKIKNSLHKNPDLIHILKVGFDIERDPGILENNTKIIQDAANVLLQILNQ